jgi:hypothetical protein
MQVNLTLKQQVGENHNVIIHLLTLKHLCRAVKKFDPGTLSSVLFVLQECLMKRLSNMFFVNNGKFGHNTAMFDVIDAIVMDDARGQLSELCVISQTLFDL